MKKVVDTYKGFEETYLLIFSVSKGDAIFMKSICHDWSDKQCLNSCYEALASRQRKGDCVIPATRDRSLGSKDIFLVDCIMLALCQGGKDRTEYEFQALAEAAGFQGFKLVCSACSFHIMEFLKKAAGGFCF